MRKFNGREMKAFFILSIVAPVGLLMTLKLTGTLKTPIAQTLALEAVELNVQRPDHSASIDDRVEATYVSEELLVNMRILVGFYHESPAHTGYNDYLDMSVAINSSVMRPDNYIGSAYVIFGKDSQPSLVDYLSTNYFKLENLSLSSVSGGRTMEDDYREAHFNVVGVNHPQSVFFQTTILWSLLTKNNETHQMQVTIELTYNNGTAYKKIVQPFELTILGA